MTIAPFPSVMGQVVTIKSGVRGLPEIGVWGVLRHPQGRPGLCIKAGSVAIETIRIRPVLLAAERDHVIGGPVQPVAAG